jgi:hypothetical protein
LATSGFERQAGLGTIQSLDLALLIQAEHDQKLGRGILDVFCSCPMLRATPAAYAVRFAKKKLTEASEGRLPCS